MNTDTANSKLPLLLVGAAVTAVLAIPALIIVVAGIAAVSASATASAAAVCTYAYPNADRIAATMHTLTAEPVQADQWDRYAHLAGIDPDTTGWESSTPAQRDDVLDAAVASLLYTNNPAAISTPPIIWWNGQLPVDDNDTTWQTTAVPGWDGTLEDYIAALVDTYASEDLNDGVGEHSCIPPAVTACPQPANTDAILATIRHLESGNNYTEHHRSIAAGGPTGSGHPSGAYQFLASTWAGYGGYDEAFQAPPNVQDERAASDVATILPRFGGDPAWVPVAWYVGLGGAQRVADGEWSPAYVPNPAHNTISIGDYQARWLDHYTTIALPTAGGDPVECPLGGLAAVAWAETQLGAPYAAIDPYRFGTPAWPGGTLTGTRGNTYTFPAGTIVYDCSGFVIAAWRAAGVDLVAQYGLYGSQSFPGSPLEEIPRTAIAPGDLAVYSPINGVGHIVMIHDIGTDGVVHTIEASPASGVRIGTIKWDRVTSIKRPPTPEPAAGATPTGGYTSTGTTGMLIGATIDRQDGQSWAQATATFEQRMGRPVQIARRFTGNNLAGNNFNLASIDRFKIDVGVRHRSWSFKGSYTDHELDRIVDQLPDDGYVTYLTWHHEADNDGGSMTPTYFKGLQARLLAAIERSGRADVVPTFVLTSWLELDNNPNTSSADWFPAQPTKWAFGIDPYDPHNRRTFAQLAEPSISLWKQHGGRRWLVTETGTHRTGNDGVNWIHNAKTWCANNGCEAFMWFHSDIGKEGPWWLDDPAMYTALGQ